MSPGVGLDHPLLREAAARGLPVVAEVELDREDQPFPRPRWLGREVTEHRRYYNVCLVEHPYSAWTEAERLA